MDVLNIIGGTTLFLLGIWLTIIQAKSLINGKPNTLGGVSGLLIIGIGCIVCGIILIMKHI